VRSLSEPVSAYYVPGIRLGSFGNEAAEALLYTPVSVHCSFEDPPPSVGQIPMYAPGEVLLLKSFMS
jgi:hypothetical protein